MHQACDKWGVKISTDKWKVLTPQSQNVSLNGETIGNVYKFIFLVSLIPYSACEIRRRIGLDIKMSDWNINKNKGKTVSSAKGAFMR